MEKLRAAILGTGNIGSDLLAKAMRSDVLECSLFAGMHADSSGIARAEGFGIRTSHRSINAIIDDPSCCEVVFDATNAEAHARHAQILSRLGKKVFDMTPSKLGKMCIPLLNLEESLQAPDINMVSCGGQASIPIAHALLQECRGAGYVEVVTSIASKSAGMGTRINIDEYLRVTRDAIRHFTGAVHAKSILNLNPAEPPINMQNTIYAEVNSVPDMEKVGARIRQTVEGMRKFTPGVRLLEEPVFEGERVTVISEVVGRGDYLPKYAGNLDIITSAAMAVAEEYARRRSSLGGANGGQ